MGQEQEQDSHISKKNSRENYGNLYLKGTHIKL